MTTLRIPTEIETRLLDMVVAATTLSDVDGINFASAMVVCPDVVCPDVVCPDVVCPDVVCPGGEAT